MFSDLNKNQKRVVRWLVDNGHEDDPIKACHAKQVSQFTLYSHWGVDNVRKWCAEYKESLEPSGPTRRDVQEALRAMVPSALNLLTTTLERGKGDRSAVVVAQWVLREAFEDVPDEQPVAESMTPAEKELDNLVRATFGGR
jgi:hypothetical protein